MKVINLIIAFPIMILAFVFLWWGMILKGIPQFLSKLHYEFNNGSKGYCVLVTILISGCIQFLITKLIKFASIIKWWLQSSFGLNVPYILVDFTICFLIVGISLLSLRENKNLDKESQNKYPDDFTDLRL